MRHIFSPIVLSSRPVEEAGDASVRVVTQQARKVGQILVGHAYRLRPFQCRL